MPAHLTDYDFAAIPEEIYVDGTRRQGRFKDEILEQVALACNGTDRLSGCVVQCPGIPDMYGYERVVYAAGALQGITQLFVAAQKLIKHVDGHIVPTATCFEPVTVPYCRELYKKRGQELFTVGMQAHELCWTDAAPIPPTNEVVRSFLDRAVAQYGARSILYISFGSLFFPLTTPELVEALIDTLLTLEQPFPFVFALGGELASLPDELIKRVNASGKRPICPFWVKQRAIL
ncbi:hypothetical protein B0H17DRAFT_394627 [Mycena rosella]|uniref:Uncharacterized protein n=1 Tax=Mycena rosella TaxID=1033263 RepID=A0AAD7CQ08_MYCRO|nr:hypothetical protein B0H17DRAFT_394627 [Mycena rosella]